MPAEIDCNGNLWAWWGGPGPGAIVTGSHLDSVPEGGAYDGPLGLVSAFAAVDLLRAHGARPARPVAVVAFADEEGARFGVACIGSRLMTGALAPDAARTLRDADGVTLADAVAAAGVDPAGLGRDDERLGRIAAFVELHIEQGRALVGRGAALGVAEAVWPHHRWRLELTGQANHAGTTRLADRHDPMLALAALVLAAREQAERAGGLATVGRVLVEPNGINAVPGVVQAWLDVRAADDATLDALAAAVVARTRQAAAAEGVAVDVDRQSASARVDFAGPLRDRILRVLGARTPVLATGAGHDAAILAAAGVPAAMIFVRNPTGVSHAPAEQADEADCLAGVEALAAVLAELAG